MTNAEYIRAHLVVRGRVQGVFFRANMREQALRHGVAGWVRNLPDGKSVEAILEGPRDAVERVVCWAMRGPPLARVEEIEVSFSDYTGEYKGFEIRYW